MPTTGGDMTRKVGLFVGEKTPSSVHRALRNVSWMLRNEFEIHVITSVQGSLPFTGLSVDRVYQGVQHEFLHPYRSEYQTLKNYLRDHDPDVVVQFTEPPRLGTVGGLASLGTDVPFVYRYSGDRFVMYRRTTGLTSLRHFLINNIVGRIPLFLAEHFIVLGPTGRQRLLERGVGRDEITVLPPTIDLEQFSKYGSPTSRFEGSLDVPDDRSVVLFVGRMSRLKGIKTLEHAIPQVLDHRDDIHFLFVGRSAELDIPDRYRDHVTIVGQVPTDEVPKYYDLADLLVHPSLVEAYARSIMEALASDVPVIARHEGEMPHITQNTFETTDELVQMVRCFETLPVDDIRPFSRTQLKERYVAFFDWITGGGRTLPVSMNKPSP